MKVIACYNIKGGVGKTASTVNLAYLSAREGFRTLIWDLDPQGASSFYYRIRSAVGAGAASLVRDEVALDKVIKGTDYENLDLVPADFSYRNIDLFLDGEKKPKQRVEKLLKPLADAYDYVFLDCPPGISLLSENVFMAADVLLVPLIPTTLSLRTLDQVLQFCQQEGLNDFSILPFFTMVDVRKALHRRIVEELPKRLPSVLTNHIPYSSEIEQMGLRRAPVNIFAGHSRSAQAYADLWWEIKIRLEWL